MMTKTEFEDLLSTSPVYKTLSVGFRKQILSSAGEERLNYERIFTVEQEGIQAAQHELSERNALVIRDFSAQVKGITRERAQAAEMKSKRKDEAAGSSLLKKLNKI